MRGHPVSILFREAICTIKALDGRRNKKLKAGKSSIRNS